MRPLGHIGVLRLLHNCRWNSELKRSETETILRSIELATCNVKEVSKSQESHTTSDLIARAPRVSGLCTILDVLFVSYVSSELLVLCDQIDFCSVSDPGEPENPGNFVLTPKRVFLRPNHTPLDSLKLLKD